MNISAHRETPMAEHRRRSATPPRRYEAAKNGAASPANSAHQQHGEFAMIERIPAACSLRCCFAGSSHHG
jgi:hypothetical protein